MPHRAVKQRREEEAEADLAMQRLDFARARRSMRTPRRLEHVGAADRPEIARLPCLATVTAGRRGDEPARRSRC